MSKDISTDGLSSSDVASMMGAFDDAIDPDGFHIEGYEIVEEIARGGMGIVYLGQQENPDREVALKVMLPQYAHEQEMRERFYIEVRAMASLDHPAILPIYEVSESDGFPFFSMKLATGGSLADRLVEGPIPPREASKLIRELADGLQHAHQRGVLHRDLKPGNFLFSKEGQVYISDFGVAKLADTKAANLTQSLAFVGTPNYLPPEVAAGSSKATIAGDIYSLGAVLYECLSGQKLFHLHENFASQLRAIVDEPILSPRSLDGSLPKDLETICLKALSRDPADRYATAEEFASDLACWENDLPIRARPLGPIESLYRRIKRHKLASALILVCILLVGISTTVITLERLRSQEAIQLRLYESLVAQAKTEQLLAMPGFREKVLSLLKQAWEISPSSRIETEAIAALTKSDLVLKSGNLTGAEGVSTGGSAPEKRSLVIDDFGRALLLQGGSEGPFRTFEPVHGGIIAADFLPDGESFLMSGSEEGIALYTNQGDKLDHQFPAPKGAVRFLTVSPTGTQAAFGGSEGLHILDLNSRTWSWSKNDQVVRCEPLWTADGQYLIAALGEKKLIQIFQAHTGNQSFTLRPSGWPELFAGDPESKFLAVACSDGSVSFFDLTTESLLARLPLAAKELHFSDEEETLFITTSDGRSLQWTIEEARGYQEWRYGVSETLSISGAELSPDGQWLLLSHTQGLELFSVADQSMRGFYSTENQRIDASTEAWWVPGTENQILLQVPGAWEVLQVDGRGSLTFSHHSDAKLPGAHIREILPNGDWLVEELDEDDETMMMIWPQADSAAAKSAKEAKATEPRSTKATSRQGDRAEILPDGRVQIQGMMDLILTPPRQVPLEIILFTRDGQRLIGIGSDNQIAEWNLETLRSELKARGFDHSLVR